MASKTREGLVVLRQRNVRGLGVALLLTTTSLAGCTKTGTETETELIARAQPEAPTAADATSTTNTTNTVGDATTADDRSAALRQRAEELWSATTQDDWKNVYRFQDPKQMEGITEDDFVSWSIANQPMKIHAANIIEVHSQSDMGWVKLENTTSMRKYPGVPPRDTTRWQKWRWVQENWYPVPEALLENYPSSPSIRNAAEEKRLLDRFEESWIARRDRDLDRLHELKDPANRPEVSESQLDAQPDPFVYLDHRVEWVEVIGDSGKVRVTIKYKSADPNMTKAPPKFIYPIERWILVDGEWYIFIS